ncbi:hypothetical protein [Terricaulis sp.]|uniref:hypothetical protein n=1 Tax=Terricaulis sp. TaxID=2768686 RepID=UPI00378370AE
MSTLAAAALALCFGPPQPVSIEGYRGHAMEPFITRDGATLFFNSRNGPHDQTDMFWAERIDDLRFRFRGPVTGGNSNALDGVPSLSRDGTFAFISTRAYEAQFATIWTGRWDGRTIGALRLERALAPGRPPQFNMDLEISADGARLYFTDNVWAAPMPRTSDLRLAVRQNGQWRRAEPADAWFTRINTRALEYAPATSPDERELFFTRLTPRFLQPPRLEIMVATRARADTAFSAPARVASIQGFVEAPSVAPDGALYFHAKIDEMHLLMRAPRHCPL